MNNYKHHIYQKNKIKILYKSKSVMGISLTSFIFISLNICLKNKRSLFITQKNSLKFKILLKM